MHSAPGIGLGAGANALILLHRVVFVDDEGSIDKRGGDLLLKWAAVEGLGQEPGLLQRVSARRTAMLDSLRARGAGVARLRVRPEWRMAVGLGNRANPHEIGLSLHGTYGWPVIPGSTLKGMTAAWARRSGGADIERIFGSPRPGVDAREAARQGTVRFLDALPADEPVTVTVDVVTPHAQPYYGSANTGASGSGVVPPAEHHNPIPSMFLTVSGGLFAVDLTGPADDVRQAARWCREAFDELGVGAKTAAGYGYANAMTAEG
ncbi:type III-B CRISPR module RAMP protein Cmr6 [Actinomadura algeriensis]|uniref:CRISPR-associated protein Cmr6 n=1 Tax=Actinomadura algeriensis TaxID=1679523 RepID=A0ABR9JUA1_9ACTN|nr:type III-B CRISPR module RAMP protein Cmr6 [Actinomadura algeriensis]MBE1533956.1 CRISPR-associated protein Cmr6 [Actinomadura algeriensis]